ncbi:MAG: lipopolysaccharide heptosyltransferase II [Acidobacteriota bacterium]
MKGRVLIVRLRSLGDVVLTTPLLQVFREAGCETAAVVERPFHAVLEGLPCLDHLFVLEPGSLVEKWRTVRRLRRLGFDWALDLHGGTTAALLTVLSGARRTLGYGAARWRRLYTEALPPPSRIWGRDNLHTVEHQLAFCKYLGLTAEPIPPLRIALVPSEVDGVRRWLQEEGVAEGFALIHPAAAFATKQWAVERFAALADWMLERGWPVVATAGPGQESLLQRLAGLTRGGLRIFPPAPLPRFAALASLCGLYIGNDTGTTHMAAALGRPIVAIFGSSNPRAWRPWGTRYRLVGSNRDCIPCPGYHCLLYPEPRCIEDVSVGRVIAAIESLEAEEG